ncbi:MAG: hypothetical protein JSS66_06455 [Armatimonadetes bacterium]|nr:hypothetical protein [Armatimonadota bacterium]
MTLFKAQGYVEPGVSWLDQQMCADDTVDEGRILLRWSPTDAPVSEGVDVLPVLLAASKAAELELEQAHQQKAATLRTTLNEELGKLLHAQCAIADSFPYDPKGLGSIRGRFGEKVELSANFYQGCYGGLYEETHVHYWKSGQFLWFRWRKYKKVKLSWLTTQRFREICDTAV